MTDLRWGLRILSSSQQLRDDRRRVMVLAPVMMSNRSKRPQDRGRTRVSWPPCGVKEEL